MEKKNPNGDESVEERKDVKHDRDERSHLKISCFLSCIQWWRMYEAVDWQALWVMNCLPSNTTIILKVDGRVNTASSADWNLPDCSVVLLSHFTELL